MSKQLTLTAFILALLACVTPASGQDFAVKTNLLYDASATVNAGIEFPFARRWTLDVSGNYNAWSSPNSLKRWKHWMVQPEARWWFCNRFAGHFFGINAMWMEYNLGGLDLGSFRLPGTDFRKLKDIRYEGYAVGAGLAYGYAFALGTHWNLELEVGAGYVYTWFDRFPCKECGRKIDDGSHHYFGPTKAAVNIVYLF